MTFVHRTGPRSGPTRGRAAVCGALALCTALAVPATAAAAPSPKPSPSSKPSASPKPSGSPSASPSAPAAPSPEMTRLLTRLQGLYQKAEAASEKYNGLVEKRKKTQARADKLGKQLKAKQSEVATEKDRAAALARAQYRQGGAPGLADLIAGDFQESVDIHQALKQGADSQARFLAKLAREQKRLDALKKQSDKAAAHAKSLAAQQKKAKSRVDSELNSVEQLVMSLSGTQLDALRKLEAQQIGAAQAAFLHSGALGKGERYPSAAGEKAISYALAQLGRPYLWGGTGPTAFDCSGLTSQAWAHAGRPIPRTSQEQWAQLPHVPLTALRPGDLVIYFGGATHVAMYLGNGLIVEAPRPGTVIKIAPIASMPILGAVRPDPLSPSVKGGYRVPAGPSGGADIGISRTVGGSVRADKGKDKGAKPKAKAKSKPAAKRAERSTPTPNATPKTSPSPSSSPAKPKGLFGSLTPSASASPSSSPAAGKS